MPNVIAHHSLTNAQPVPKQRATIPMPIPQFHHMHDTILWYGTFLWPVSASCPGCIPFQLLAPPRLLTGRVGVRS